MRLARLAAADAKHADRLLISCGGLRTFGLLAPLEAELGIPVTASSLAGFWDVVRVAGLDPRLTASTGCSAHFLPAKRFPPPTQRTPSSRFDRRAHYVRTTTCAGSIQMLTQLPTSNIELGDAVVLNCRPLPTGRTR